MSKTLGEVLADKPRIRLLACDVDGVLTDGAMYYGVDGQVLKRFNVKDGQGMALLRNAGVRLAFITADSSEICRARGEKLRVHDICIAVSDKSGALAEIQAREAIGPEATVYVGDDLPDLCVLPLVGVFVAPADAVGEVREAATFVTEAGGGNGAMREVCDAIRAHNAELPE